MDQFTSFTPIVFFIMGIGGSLHCLGMCGPLVMSLTKNKIENLIFQIGRLAGYMSLGLMIKILGQLFTKNQNILIFVAGILLGLFYIMQGLALLKIIKEIKINFLNGITSWARNKFKNRKTPLFTGFLTAFLPCGLLYTTLFSLLVIQDFRIALLSLFAFWLGTVPALFFSSMLMEKAIRPVLLQIPKLAGALLLTIGLTTIALRLAPLVTGKKSCAHCYINQK